LNGERSRPPSGSYWIVPEKLLGGAHPASLSLADTIRRLEMLVGRGVTSFVDLTEPGEAPPYIALAPDGGAGRTKELRYVRMPLPDHKIPPSPQCMNAILDHVERELADGHSVFLHCRAGIGRTGTVAGCHLIRGGMAPEEALQYLQRQWEQGGRTAVWPHTPETDEQMEYVRRWGTARAGEAPVGSWWKRFIARD
jgi:hypothetical protein